MYFILDLYIDADTFVNIYLYLEFRLILGTDVLSVSRKSSDCKCIKVENDFRELIFP